MERLLLFNERPTVGASSGGGTRDAGERSENLARRADKACFLSTTTLRNTSSMSGHILKSSLLQLPPEIIM